jgi:large subunit ribosomal protein L30
MNDPLALDALPPEGAQSRPAGNGGARTDAAGPKMMRVTLVRSVAGTRQDHRATVRGLGLRRLNHSVEVVDTPATRGMVNKVGYLVKVTDANG